jgi:hypothetical protein
MGSVSALEELTMDPKTRAHMSDPHGTHAWEMAQKHHSDAICQDDFTNEEVPPLRLASHHFLRHSAVRAVYFYAGRVLTCVRPFSVAVPLKVVVRVGHSSVSGNATVE